MVVFIADDICYACKDHCNGEIKIDFLYFILNIIICPTKKERIDLNGVKRECKFTSLQHENLEE